MKNTLYFSRKMSLNEEEITAIIFGLKRSSNKHDRREKRIKRFHCSGIHDECMNEKYKCCICMDKREIQDSYPGYIDGYGECNSKCRSADYCPSCKSKCILEEVNRYNQTSNNVK